MRQLPDGQLLLDEHASTIYAVDQSVDNGKTWERLFGEETRELYEAIRMLAKAKAKSGSKYRLIKEETYTSVILVSE